MRRGATRMGVAAYVSTVGLLVCLLAFVPVAGYVLTVVVPALAARMRGRHAARAPVFGPSPSDAGGPRAAPRNRRGRSAGTHGREATPSSRHVRRTRARRDGTSASGRFVPEHVRHLAYEDGALPIGNGQTISQPFIVATICQLLGLSADDRVLDVGTGSGYQAAVLAELAAEVVTIERVPELAKDARAALVEAGTAMSRFAWETGHWAFPTERRSTGSQSQRPHPRSPHTLYEQLVEGGGSSFRAEDVGVNNSSRSSAPRRTPRALERPVSFRAARRRRRVGDS